MFLHIFRWPEEGALQFPALKDRRLQSARVLSGGDVTAHENDGGFAVDVPKSARGAIPTTVELTFDGETQPVEPLQRRPSLSKEAGLTASHGRQQLNRLVDQDVSTNWEAHLGKGEKEFWIEAAFDEPKTIGWFSVARGEEWVPKNVAEIQIPDDSKGWKTVSAKGMKLKWETMKPLDPPVTTDRIRLRVTGTNRFVFTEFELFPPVR